ncbi:methyltransferase type 12 [Sphingomonas lacunae]|uniref:Methyltransferase type 12 n=2 Tax=Sphingomonas lacunae TaxID=2698828 RepID=A0A6M4AZ62_9SPHN|nr:methyltransferase type 12 [Sphingomonas lacunae]
MGQQLLDRLGDLTRTFANVLIIGRRCPSLIAGLAAIPATSNAQISFIEQSATLAERFGVIIGEEDQLPVEPDSFDCILWPGGLESVNDVPGALLRCRLALHGDGLLLGCFPGDGSFPLLRQVMRHSDGDVAVARMHPQLDARAMGDVLAKVGLTMTVVDCDRLTLSYASLADLVADLRSAAWTNMLSGAVRPITRQGLDWANSAFAAASDNGRALEQLRLIHFSGWSPHPDQPKAARRGSATMSLAKALRAR